MNEPKLRLLRLEEVKGANRLSVIKTRGALANPTDFADLEGSLWQTYIKDNYEVDKKGNKRHYRTRELICGNYYLEKQDRDEKICRISSFTDFVGLCKRRAYVDVRGMPSTGYSEQ